MAVRINQTLTRSIQAYLRSLDSDFPSTHNLCRHIESSGAEVDSQVAPEDMSFDSGLLVSWRRWDPRQSISRQNAKSYRGAGGPMNETSSNYETQEARLKEQQRAVIIDPAHVPVHSRRAKRERDLRTNALSLEGEMSQELIAILEAAGSYATGHDVTPANKWDTAAGDPIADIEAGIKKVRIALRGENYSLRLAYRLDTWAALRENSKIKQDYQGAGGLTEDALRMKLKLREQDRLINLDDEVNTAREGADFSGTQIFGPHFVIYAQDANEQTDGFVAANFMGLFNRRYQGIRGFRVEDTDAGDRHLSEATNLRRWVHPQALCPWAGYILRDCHTP